MNPKPATIADVAAAAGVSVATVSRALRGLPNVAPSTRERVQKAALQLQYRPDPSASALAAGRTHTVAMAVPLLDSWYFSQVMSGAEAVLSDAGYDLLLFAVDGEERRHRTLGGPLVKRADGLILVDLRMPAHEAEALTSGRMKLVSVGIAVQGASSVTVDDFGLAREAVTHLVELGHTDIGLIDGRSDDPQGFLVPEQRRLGYRAALSEAGHPTRPELEVPGNFSVAGGREAMARLLALDEPPTAVFAMSDEMAFGALRELWDRGLRCPEDMSIVGVDNHDLSEVIGLTTVHQEVAQHGAIAAQLLLDHLDDADLPTHHHTAETTLVHRSTTGPRQAD